MVEGDESPDGEWQVSGRSTNTSWTALPLSRRSTTTVRTLVTIAVWRPWARARHVGGGCSVCCRFLGCGTLHPDVPSDDRSHPETSPSARLCGPRFLHL